MSTYEPSDRVATRKLTVLLGPLQVAVMRCLWTHGAATVREIQEQLTFDTPLAYSTILTSCLRLQEKGLLERRRVTDADERSRPRSAYVYTPRLSEEAFTQAALAQQDRPAANTLFGLRSRTAEADSDEGHRQPPERARDEQVERAARPDHAPADVHRGQRGRAADDHIQQSLRRIASRASRQTDGLAPSWSRMRRGASVRRCAGWFPCSDIARVTGRFPNRLPCFASQPTYIFQSPTTSST